MRFAFSDPPAVVALILGAAGALSAAIRFFLKAPGQSPGHLEKPSEDSK